MKQSVLIIAEAGVNHNGDFDLAKRLVDAAANAKADFIKFQTFKADKTVTKSAQKAEYQSKNIKDSDQSQYKMLKQLELSEAWHYDLVKYCAKKGIKFLSTGFDKDSIDFLDKLNIPLFKIPSGEITNKPYLRHIALKQKPVILSTGMADLKEVADALNVLTAEGLSKKNITILHCNTEYPTPMEDVNLHAMNSIKNELQVNIGYSDHTVGIEVPIAAVALGATVIEKHFTIDRNLPGPDHKASLEPDELTAMVKAIRNIELAISGNGIKGPSKSELKNKPIVRKSIFTSRPLSAGHVILDKDLTTLRPGDGISPMDWDQVIGKVVNKDLPEYHQLNWNDLK